MSNVNIFETLVEEKFEEGYDPSFAGLPLRKGKYENALVRFRQTNVPAGERWGMIDGSPVHVYTRLEARVDGKGFADAFLSTKPYKAGKDTEKLTSNAVKFLRGLGKTEDAVEADSPIKLAQVISETLGDEGVRATILVDWETDTCKDCRDRGLRNSKDTPISVRGENNFPRDGEGNPLPTTSCPTCGAELRAKATFSVVGK